MFIPAKSLKLAMNKRGLLILKHLPAELRSAGRLFNKLSVVKYLPGAPKGFRNVKDLRERILNAKTIAKLIHLLPAIRRALSKADFNEVAADIADIADLKPCVQGLVNALQ